MRKLPFTLTEVGNGLIRYMHNLAVSKGQGRGSGSGPAVAVCAAPHLVHTDLWVVLAYQPMYMLMTKADGCDRHQAGSTLCARACR